MIGFRLLQISLLSTLFLFNYFSTLISCCWFLFCCCFCLLLFSSQITWANLIPQITGRLTGFDYWSDLIKFLSRQECSRNLRMLGDGLEEVDRNYLNNRPMMHCNQRCSEGMESGNRKALTLHTPRLPGLHTIGKDGGGREGPSNEGWWLIELMLSLTEIINYSRKKRFCGWNSGLLNLVWAVSLGKCSREFEKAVSEASRASQSNTHYRTLYQREHNETTVGWPSNIQN